MGSPRVSRGACLPTNEGLVETRTRGGTPGPGTYRRGSTPVERPYPVGAVDCTTMNGRRAHIRTSGRKGLCIPVIVRALDRKLLMSTIALMVEREPPIEIKSQSIACSVSGFLGIILPRPCLPAAHVSTVLQFRHAFFRVPCAVPRGAIISAWLMASRVFGTLRNMSAMNGA